MRKLILIAILATSGIAAILLPNIILFKHARSFLDAYGSGGRAEAYTEAIHTRVSQVALSAGIIILLSALILPLIPGRLLNSWVTRLRRDFYECLPSGIGSSADYWPLLMIMVACSLARWCFMQMPIRYDEAITYLSAASRPIFVTVSSYYAPNNHILHSVLVKLSCLAFGPSPIAIRIPTFLAGILTIPAAWLATRSVLHRYQKTLDPAIRWIAPITAATLVGCSSLMIEYSVNARGYMICTLLTLTCVVVAEFAARRDNFVAWFALGILFAAGLWTIPTMLFPMGMILLWLASSSQIYLPGETHLARQFSVVGRLIMVICTTGAVTTLLYSPVLAVDGYSAIVANPWVKPLSTAEFVARLPSATTEVLSEWGSDFPLSSGWILMVFAVIGVSASGTHGQRLSLPTCAIVAAIAICAVQRVIPFTRVWLPFLAVILVYSGIGISLAIARSRRLLQAYPSGLLFVLMPLTLVWVILGSRITETNQTSSADQVASLLGRLLQEGDQVASKVPTDGTLDYYFVLNRIPRTYLSQHAGGQSPRRLFLVVNTRHEDTVEELLDEFRQTRRLPTFSEPQLIESVGMAQIWRCEASVSTSSPLSASR